MAEPTRFNLDELADRGGVSRRTVRYYIQEGLLPAPLGVGRGRHYDRTHLERLLLVKALQEGGRSLEDIRALFKSESQPQLWMLSQQRRFASSRSALEARAERPSLVFATEMWSQANELRADAAPALSDWLKSALEDVPRTTWRRLELAPGVELHVSADVRLPGPARLAELAAWCRLYLPASNSPRKED